MSTTVSAARPGAGHARVPDTGVRSWRVTTAVRVFVLALAAGQVVGAGTLGSVGHLLLGLALLTGVCCAVELRTEHGGAWVPVVEGAAAGLLIGLPGGQVEPLFVYLALPAVVSGFRLGAVASVRTTLVTGAVVLAGGLVGGGSVATWPGLASLTQCLAVGLGAGLVAASQTRSVRRLEAAQAPYAAAHRLVGQLHDLAQQLPMGLDVAASSRSMLASVSAAAETDASAVLIGTSALDLELLVSAGDVSQADFEVARRCVASRRRVQRHDEVALPLRVGDHVFGAVLLTGRTPSRGIRLDALQQQVDEQAIVLDTALLVESVRLLATTEERNRLARDLHDGVAQEIVGLAYLAEDIAAANADPRAQRGLVELRDEVSRLVSSLRFSVFDLRHEVEDAGGLTPALSDYVRELGAHSDLRVHLMLDERHALLSRRTEEELLCIAREAIGNVRRHARAINLWVKLTVVGTDVRLVVEDDGVGAAAPRAGHYGLHSMRERADRIDADLTVTDRPDGGTVVTLRSRPSIPTIPEDSHDQCAARR